MFTFRHIFINAFILIVNFTLLSQISAVDRIVKYNSTDATGDIQPAVDRIVKYNSTDATRNIQEALYSGADRVIIPYQGAGTKWISGPLRLASDTELVLEPGVILEAKSGAFTSTTPFLKVVSKSNITITGYGATIRMLIDEYTSGEGPTCISLYNCSNITVKGVTLQKSGGDGIYIGAGNSSQNYCDTVLIKDVTCDGNGRMGIAVISAKNLTVDNCEFKNTGQYNPSGLATGGPWAGICFEPNDAAERLENIIVKNSTFDNNKNYGLFFALSNQDNTTRKISINADNCYIKNSDYGIRFTYRKDSENDSFVEVKNSTIEDTETCAIYFENWAHGNSAIVTDCTIINPTQNSTIGDAIRIATASDTTVETGDINISGTYIYDNISPYALAIYGGNQDYHIKDVVGSLYADFNSSIYIRPSACVENIDVDLHKFYPDFDVAFSGDADDVGGTDSEAFLTSSDAIVYPGDYNGDGKTDLFVKGYGTYRTLYLANSAGDGFNVIFSGDAYGVGGTSNEAFFTSPDAIVYPGDYNGDGKTDLFGKGYQAYRFLYYIDGFYN